MVSLGPSVIYFLSLPLDAGQDCSDVISRAPSVLKNVQAKLAGGINVGVEHFADELDLRRLIRVLFLKLHHQSKGAVFEWGIRGADNHCVPARCWVSIQRR